jgi:hypothetical protein
MSEQNKTRELPDPDIFGPPFFGVGLGEKLGSLDAKLIHLEKRMDERFSHVDEKFSHVDEKFANLEKRMDDKFTGLEKRMDSDTRVLWGMLMAMLAAIVIQKFI